MALPIIFGEFRVVADPELRFTPAGKAVGNVRLVANSKKKNEDTGQWDDDKVLWLRGSIWGTEAENMVESITKGMLVEVRGRLKTDEYEKDGEKRQVTEVMIDAISPSIKFATAKVAKVERVAPSASEVAAKAAVPEDPWASPPQTEEPPF